MDTKRSPEVWDRLSNESGRAYEAFKVYMFMSPAERSVVGAWREWTENPEAVHPQSRAATHRRAQSAGRDGRGCSRDEPSIPSRLDCRRGSRRCTSLGRYLPIRSTERQICVAVLHCEGAWIGE